MIDCFIIREDTSLQIKIMKLDNTSQIICFNSIHFCVKAKDPEAKDLKGSRKQKLYPE